MEHKRPIILGVLFKKGTGANLPMLDAEYDESHIKSLQQKSKETISLDACFKAYSREELLSGAD